VFCILVQFIKQIDGEIQTAQQRRRRRQAGRQDENGISQEVNEGVAVRGKKATALAIWNCICFQGKCWSKGEAVLREMARLTRNWTMVNRPEEVEVLERWVLELERRSARPPRLMWHQTSRSFAPEGGTTEAILICVMCLVAWSQ
jgi:hypothetical protein